MPRYYALNTAIKLVVWDTHSISLLEVETSQNDDTPTLNSNDATAKHNGFAKPEKRREIVEFGPAAGHLVDELKEEYFEGLEGVDFIAPGMPFYLVKAGRELFPAEQSPEEKTGGPSRDFDDTKPFTTLSRISANEIDHVAPSSQDGDNDSSLSSISTSFFSTASESHIVEQREDTSEEAEARSSVSPHQSPRIRRESLDEAVAKPITTPTPLTIVVDLSRKSFDPSLVNGLKQELCITIFYNGELTHSRIIRPNLSSNIRGPVDDEKYQYYSGRRIDTGIECPWVVLPNPPSGEGTVATGELRTLEFAERWQNISQMLLAEAGEWGRYGKSKSPMSEYLEALSMRPVPKNTMGNGLGAGIIDVVITLGRAVSASVTGLREPRRKLHEDFCGLKKQWVVAPEEFRPAKKAKIVADSNLETSQHVAPSENSGNTPVVTETSPRAARTLLNYSANQYSSSSCDVKANQENAGALAGSKQPQMDSNEGPSIDILATPMHPPRCSRTDSLPLMASSSPMPPDMSATKLIRDHPKKPRNVPQKHYKGTDPSPGDEVEPSPKRQKCGSILDFLPFDSEKPASASTRSKRSTTRPSFSSLANLETNRRQQFAGARRRLGKTKNTLEQLTGNPVPPAQLVGGSDFKLEDEGNPCSSDDQRNGRNALHSAVIFHSVEMQPGKPKTQIHDQDHSRSLIETNCGVLFSPQSLSNQQSLPQTAGVIVTPTAEFQASGVERHFCEEQANGGQSFAPQDSSPARDRIKSFGYVGAEEGHRPESMPLSSTASIYLRSSISKTEKELSTENAASPDGQLRHMSPETNPSSSRKVTCIVFKLDERIFSTSVSRESFQALGLPAYDTKASIRPGQEKHPIKGRNKNATQKGTESMRRVSYESTTGKHSSPIRKRRNVEVLATTPKVVAANETVFESPPVSTNSATSRKQHTVEYFVQPINYEPRESKQSGWTGTRAETESMRGKPLLFPAPGHPAFTRRESKSSGSSRVPSTALTSSVVPENTELTLKMQSRPKRNSVSLRELKNLLSPHKSFTAVDISLGSSSTEAHKMTRSSRNSKSNYGAPTIPAAAETSDLIAINTKVASNKVSAMSALINDGIMIFRTKPINEATIGEVSGDPTHLSTTPSNTRSNSKLSNAHMSPLGPPQFNKTPTNAKSKCMAIDTTSITGSENCSQLAANPSPEQVNDRFSDMRIAEEISEKTCQSGNQMSGASGHAILSSRQPSRGYTVDSEGKKTPTQRENSVSSKISLRPSRPQRKKELSTPKPQPSVAPLSRGQKLSLSQEIPQAPEMRITRKRKVAISLVLEKGGEPSATPSAPNVKVPKIPLPSPSLAKTRVPISQRLKLPALNATIITTTLPAMETPDSRSHSKVKRSATEVPSPSMTRGIVPPSRQWNPNHMCDESVLTYASGEAWPGVSVDQVSGQVVRNIRMEREGVFRASGVLMGVRFVVGLL